MIKVSHEMPLELMLNGAEKNINDYSYALVHLFEENEQYYQFFVDALKSGREVILDNSIFELGEAFEMGRFVDWINKLAKDAGKADTLVYVIPDVYNEAQKTLDNTKEFFITYGKSVPGKPMAVAQGTTFGEFINCFKELKKYDLDRIGIPFGSAAYEAFFKHMGVREYTKLEAQKKGRQLLVENLYHADLLEDTKVHLLGAALPSEFMYYTVEHPELSDYIVSLDTSNPIIHGLLGIAYPDDLFMEKKESMKVADIIEKPIADFHEEAIILIDHNTRLFRAVNDL